MFNSVLIIAKAEGFLVKGLQKKLKEIHIDADYCAPRVKDMEFQFRNRDFIFIFTDDLVGEYADALVFIKDRCNELDEQIIVIGAEEEYETLTRYIPEIHIYKFYKRPMDMEAIISEVDRYRAEGADQAKRKSILIVDDDVAYMSMIKEWLKDTYRVSVVNSGVQAITWLAKNKADLILLDYEMPVTPGPKVLEMIRSDPELADSPVMFLTGKGDKQSIMSVLALKPVGYQLKTVDKKTLRDNIEAYFSGQKTTQ